MELYWTNALSAMYGENMNVLRALTRRVWNDPAGSSIALTVMPGSTLKRGEISTEPR